MAKTNVSKGDLRSAKPKSNTYSAVYNRARCVMLTSKNLCRQCGKNHVQGRKICIACSKYGVRATALSYFRKVLREHGIDNPTDALETLSVAKGEDNRAVITALMNAIEACEYRGDVG